MTSAEFIRPYLMQLNEDESLVLDMFPSARPADKVRLICRPGSNRLIDYQLLSIPQLIPYSLSNIIQFVDITTFPVKWHSGWQVRLLDVLQTAKVTVMEAW